MPARPLAVALACAVLGLAIHVSAAPSSSETAYKAAVKLEASGDVAGALAAFEAIDPAKRDYATKLHIASCKYKLNRLLEAEAAWEAIRTDPKADAATIETAASELTDVRERIPKLRVTVAAGTGSVVVKLDGHEIPAGSVQRVNPGAHVVTAERAGVSVFERKLEVAQSTTLDAIVDAPAAAVTKTAPPAPVTNAPTPVSDVDSNRGLKRATPFFAAGLVFGAGVVVSRIAVGASAKTVEENCLTQHAVACDVDAAGAGRVHTFETLSFVSAGLAITSIGVGVVLMVTTNSEPARTVAVVPTFGAVNGLAMEGRF